MADRFNLEDFTQRLNALSTDDKQLEQFEPLLREGNIKLYVEPTTIATIIEVGGLILTVLDALSGPPDYSFSKKAIKLRG